MCDISEEELLADSWLGDPDEDDCDVEDEVSALALILDSLDWEFITSMDLCELSLWLCETYQEFFLDDPTDLVRDIDEYFANCGA